MGYLRRLEPTISQALAQNQEGGSCTHLPTPLQKPAQRSRRRPARIPIVLHRVFALLQLLHLGRHGRLVPFLARARDGAFVGDELVELAPDRGRVVVAGDFAFDFFEVDGAVVALFGGGGGGGRVGVDVLFVGRAFVFGFVFGGGFGVGGGSVGGSAGASGTTRCFGHSGGWMVVAIVAVGWGDWKGEDGNGEVC